MSLQRIIRRRQEEWESLSARVGRELHLQNVPGQDDKRRARVMRLAEQAHNRAHFKSLGDA